MKEYPDYKYRPKKRTRSSSEASGLREKQEKLEGDEKKRRREEIVDMIDKVHTDFQLKREPQSFSSFPASSDSDRYRPTIGNQTLR